MNLALFKNLCTLSSFCGVVLFASCSSEKPNKIYENRASDQMRAKLIADSFFKIMQLGDFERTYSLFTDRFFTITDTSKLANFFIQLNSRCGEVQSVDLLDSKSLVVEADSLSEEFILIYVVRRSKCKTIETFMLRNQKKMIRITSYDVKSDE